MAARDQLYFAWLYLTLNTAKPFNTERLMRKNGNSISSDWPIFVLGTQRSGTTLLCRMLSAHPSLFIQNELDVRRMFDGQLNRKLISERIEKLIELEHGVSLKKLLTDADKQYWGLKDPELTDYLDELECFLPDTRIIIIVRDGRAVVSSYIKNRWGLGTNAYTGALRWKREVLRQKEFQRSHSENVLILRFEDLILDTRNELQRICEFLGLEFKDEMLSYHSKPAFYRKGRENLMTFKRPDPGSLDKWRKDLSKHEQSLVVHVCGSQLEEFGYEVQEVPRKPSRLEIKRYELHQRIVGEFQIQFRWRLSQLKRLWRNRMQRSG